MQTTTTTSAADLPTLGFQGNNVDLGQQSEAQKTSAKANQLGKKSINPNDLNPESIAKSKRGDILKEGTRLIETFERVVNEFNETVMKKTQAENTMNYQQSLFISRPSQPDLEKTNALEEQCKKLDDLLRKIPDFRKESISVAETLLEKLPALITDQKSKDVISMEFLFAKLNIQKAYDSATQLKDKVDKQLKRTAEFSSGDVTLAKYEIKLRTTFDAYQKITLLASKAMNTMEEAVNLFPLLGEHISKIKTRSDSLRYHKHLCIGNEQDKLEAQEPEHMNWETLDSMVDLERKTSLVCLEKQTLMTEKAVVKYFLQLSGLKDESSDLFNESIKEINDAQLLMLKEMSLVKTEINARFQKEQTFKNRTAEYKSVYGKFFGVNNPNLLAVRKEACTKIRERGREIHQGIYNQFVNEDSGYKAEVLNTLQNKWLQLLIKDGTTQQDANAMGDLVFIANEVNKLSNKLVSEVNKAMESIQNQSDEYKSQLDHVCFLLKEGRTAGYKSTVGLGNWSVVKAASFTMGSWAPNWMNRPSGKFAETVAEYHPLPLFPTL